MDSPDTAGNTQESMLSMFRTNGPMMITGGQYTISNNTSPSTAHDLRQVLLDLFERHVSLSATHDTIEDHRPTLCSPFSAQQQLLVTRLLVWARDNDPHAPPVLWVTGPTRSGKTAIASTFAEILQSNDLLGATFFLNPESNDNGERGGITTRGATEPFLVPTLALQLCETVPALQPLMICVMQRAPFLFQRSLSTQMERLIVQPLLMLPFVSIDGNEATKFQPVIIVDGLDSHHAAGGAAERVLNAIQDAAHRLRGRVKFLILSRPQSTMLASMNSITLRIDLEPTTHAIHTNSPLIINDNQTVGIDAIVQPSPRDAWNLPQNPTVTPISHTHLTENVNHSMVNQATATNSGYAAQTQTFYMPPLPDKDICVECMMRDADMADVDVLSPGAWERESDYVFEELKARQQEEEANGGSTHLPNAKAKPTIATTADPLTESNFKLWSKESSYELSANPTRIRILTEYLKSQWDLLESEQASRYSETSTGSSSQKVQPTHEHTTFSDHSNRLMSDNCDVKSLQQGHLAPDSHTHMGLGPKEMAIELKVHDRQQNAARSVEDQPQSAKKETLTCDESLLYSYSINTTFATPEFATTDDPPEMEFQPVQHFPWSFQRFMGLLTYPLENLFSSWTTLFFQQWP